MNRLVVKVCGMTRLDDAALAASLGAQAVGFVFWPESPRAVTVAAARDIARALPPQVTAVGVFVNQPADAVNNIAHDVGLGAVQLHGDEDQAYCARMRRPVIKAIALRSSADLDAASRWPQSVTLLLDVHDPERRGGTGRVTDWALAAEAARGRRVMLAGGLCAGNLRDAVRQVAPWGVDVASGVEQRPGIKDAELMRAFFAALHIMKEEHA
jgi:phosphoribosylanthranilate isomerase